MLKNRIYGVDYWAPRARQEECGSALAVLLRDRKILGSDPWGCLFTGLYAYDAQDQLNKVQRRFDVPPEGIHLTGFCAGPAGATLDIVGVFEKSAPKMATVVEVRGAPVEVQITYLGPLPSGSPWGAQHRVAMSDIDRRILMGRIAGPHGVHGNVMLETYTGVPQDIAAYGPLQTEDGARQFNISVVRVTPKGVIARIEGISDRTGAETLKGLKLFVDRSRLPPAKEGEFYQTDLIGLRVEDRDGQLVGTVAAVQNYGAGDLLEIRVEGKHRTELVPFTDSFVPLVDVAGGRVVVVLPSELRETD